MLLIIMIIMIILQASRWTQNLSNTWRALNVPNLTGDKPYHGLSSLLGIQLQTWIDFFFI